jgi:hypothetical protein
VGAPLLFGEDAIPYSDWRDASSPTAYLNKNGKLTTRKFASMMAIFKSPDESFPSIADLSHRYAMALELLQSQYNASPFHHAQVLETSLSTYKEPQINAATVQPAALEVSYCIEILHRMPILWSS